MSSVFAVFEGVRGVFPGCRGRRWGVRSGLWGHGAVKTDGTPVPGPRVPLAPLPRTQPPQVPGPPVHVGCTGGTRYGGDARARGVRGCN